MNERAVPDHRSSTLSASAPSQRIAELTSLTIHLRDELDDALREKKKLEARLLRYEGLGHASFGGTTVSQIWADFVLWEGLLNSKEFKAVFELGTWLGGFSWWLWAQCEARGMWFSTFDTIAPQREMPDMVFEKADVFASAKKLGALFREHEPCVVFCDNGNKPRELRTYAEQLKHPDSVLVVHDWGTEIFQKDVPDTLKMVHREFCEEINSISRVFQRRADDS